MKPQLGLGRRGATVGGGRSRHEIGSVNRDIGFRLSRRRVGGPGQTAVLNQSPKNEQLEQGDS